MKFKASSIDITPQKEVFLSGFGSRTLKVNKVHSKLEASAFILGTDNELTLICVFDTLFISAALDSYLKEVVRQLLPDIRTENIWILATHTHYSPSLELLRKSLGTVDLDYFTDLQSNVYKLIQSLKLQVFNDVELEVHQTSQTNYTSSRRRHVIDLKNKFKHIITMEPEPSGAKDELATLIKVNDKNTHRIVACICSLPCHPTNLPDNLLVSAEYPGYIRAAIKDNYKDKGLQVIFLQGFSGEIRAIPPKQTGFNYALRKFLKIEYLASMYKHNWDSYNKWANQLAMHFVGLCNITGTPITFSEVRTCSLEYDIEHLLGLKAEGIDKLKLKSLLIGNALIFVGVSAEVVSIYSHFLRQLTQAQYIVPVGYMGEVFGYLPTKQMLLEGGYEATGFKSSFLVNGEFNSNFEENFKLCLTQIIPK